MQGGGRIAVRVAAAVWVTAVRLAVVFAMRAAAVRVRVAAVGRAGAAVRYVAVRASAFAGMGNFAFAEAAGHNIGGCFGTGKGKGDIGLFFGVAACPVVHVVFDLPDLIADALRYIVGNDGIPCSSEERIDA